MKGIDIMKKTKLYVVENSVEGILAIYDNVEMVIDYIMKEWGYIIADNIFDNEWNPIYDDFVNWLSNKSTFREHYSEEELENICENNYEDYARECLSRDITYFENELDYEIDKIYLNSDEFIYD
jgi:hypothetical protein